MKKHFSKSKGEAYQSPWVEVVEMAPSQIICGSNETIGEGEEIDWVIMDQFELLENLF